MLALIAVAGILTMLLVVTSSVAYLVLPRGRMCPRCGGCTSPIVLRRMLRVLSRWVQWRWCSRCAWGGPRQNEPGAGHPRPAGRPRIRLQMGSPQPPGRFRSSTGGTRPRRRRPPAPRPPILPGSTGPRTSGRAPTDGWSSAVRSVGPITRQDFIFGPRRRSPRPASSGRRASGRLTRTPKSSPVPLRIDPGILPGSSPRSRRASSGRLQGTRRPPASS